MRKGVYRLVKLEPPIKVIEPGTYLYSHGSERVEVELFEPIPTRRLAALVRHLPAAKETS